MSRSDRNDLASDYRSSEQIISGEYAAKDSLAPSLCTVCFLAPTSPKADRIMTADNDASRVKGYQSSSLDCSLRSTSIVQSAHFYRDCLGRELVMMNSGRVRPSNYCSIRRAVKRGLRLAGAVACGIWSHLRLTMRRRAKISLKIAGRKNLKWHALALFGTQLGARHDSSTSSTSRSIAVGKAGVASCAAKS